MDVNEVKDILSSKNIKLSYPRIKIYEYLIKNPSHPTVDEIYLGLLHEIPTLSKTTVYNTLKMMIEKGLVQLITIEDTETRYDADNSCHGHFKCKECKTIYDFHVNLEHLITDDLDDFIVDEKNIYFGGVCKTCREKLSEVEN